MMLVEGDGMLQCVREDAAQPGPQDNGSVMEGLDSPRVADMSTLN